MVDGPELLETWLAWLEAQALEGDDMGNWLTILLPLILEIIKQLLAREKAAAVNGFDGPATAAIAAYEASSARCEALESGKPEPGK